MKKIVFKQIFTLFICLTMHYNVINAMKRQITEISNYQKIAVQTPSQKLKLEAQFSCYICYKKFTRNDYLTNHILAHIKKNYYPCKLCPQRLTYQSDYIKHINAHIPLEVRIKNAFIKKINIYTPKPIPIQSFPYLPLEDLPFETAIQELEWT